MNIKPLWGSSRIRGLCTAAIIVALSVTGGCGPAGDGLKKFPVQGTVTINGEPEADLIVRFVSTDNAKSGANASYPVGVTNEEGVFRVSTNGVADGAVPGNYDVTIVWPESNEPPLRDRLGGEFATPAKSNLHVTIEAQENVLPTFKLVREKGKGVAKPTSLRENE